MQKNWPNSRSSHKLRFDPVINSCTAKRQGTFDPMEEIIGLFKVIFVPENGNETIDPIVQQYTWIAAGPQSRICTTQEHGLPMRPCDSFSWIENGNAPEQWKNNTFTGLPGAGFVGIRIA